uniref:BLOC-1-related complex subunit 6 C-terminal helix domain-containing protein n=1 Tax=Parascaris univalens TaxID=6257 RepID=A0A915CCA2_PARUN
MVLGGERRAASRAHSMPNTRLRTENEMDNSPSTSRDTQHTFVVEDLERRIRDSARIGSPISTPASEGSRRGSVPGSLTPDPLVLVSLESSARTISANLDVLLRDLRGSLHGMSDLTVEASECYSDAISSTCDSVDAVIKNTYAMLAKVEELNEAMVGVKRLAQQVKDIKRVVDLFESHFTMIKGNS